MKRAPIQQQGNILFLILISMALFAMLTFAVTDAENESTDMDSEMAALYATQIIQYANDLKTTVARLRMINECSDEQISFAYDSDGDGDVDASDYFYNASAPDKCMVFGNEGGNMTYDPLDAKVYVNQSSLSVTQGYGIPLFTSELEVSGIGSYCGSTSGNGCNELVFMAHYITEDICRAINKKLGNEITTFASESIPGLDGGVSDHFTGSYSSIANTLIGDQQMEFVGKYSGCIYRSYQPGYNYYHVLVAR